MNVKTINGGYIMENTFKFIPVTLALLFGGAVLARESVTCTIEYNWLYYQGKACISFTSSDSETEIFFVPVNLTAREKLIKSVENNPEYEYEKLTAKQKEQKIKQLTNKLKEIESYVRNQWLLHKYNNLEKQRKNSYKDFEDYKKRLNAYDRVLFIPPTTIKINNLQTVNALRKNLKGLNTLLPIFKRTQKPGYLELLIKPILTSKFVLIPAIATTIIYVGRKLWTS